MAKWLWAYNEKVLDFGGGVYASIPDPSLSIQPSAYNFPFAGGTTQQFTATPTLGVSWHIDSKPGDYGGIQPDAINGAGGGGGGGVCCVYAYRINNGGSIEANGGAGGDANTGPYNNYGGAGGGGGGGTVIVYYRQTTGSGVGTLSAAGGAAGSNNGGSGIGANAGTTGLTMSCQI